PHAPPRGSACSHDGQLALRPDPTSQDETAADILATRSEAELGRMVRDLGEERFARVIASAIARRRERQPLRTTRELRELVERTIPRRYWPKRIQPATRTFQALRIEVNSELESLE